MPANEPASQTSAATPNQGAETAVAKSTVQGKPPAIFTQVDADEQTLAAYAQNRSAAEWIFGMENGAMARDANSIELEQLYNGFVKRLVNSYDKLKTKFNTYAAKCLSEKQKRECGLALIAPALVMPHDRAVTDDD